MVINDPIYAVNYNILRIENGMAGNCTNKCDPGCNEIKYTISTEKEPITDAFLRFGGVTMIYLW